MILYTVDIVGAIETIIGLVVLVAFVFVFWWGIKDEL